MSENVWLKSGKVMDLLPATLVTITGDWRYKDSPYTAFQATVTGTGAVTGTVIVEGSLDGVNAVATALATIPLSGTTAYADGFVTEAPWKYVRARVTAITGTGASITVLMGV
jgi:hypothetical protein